MRVGQQVCTGHIGIFTRRDAKNREPRPFLQLERKPCLSSVGMSVVPASQYIAMIASSISTEPSSV